MTSHYQDGATMLKFIAIIFIVFSGSSAGAEEIIGEWQERWGQQFRYHSFASYRKVSRPLKNFPWIQEDCHDEGDRFANWNKTLKYSINYQGKVGFSFLGLGLELGSEVGRSLEFGLERWIHATRGMRARHILYEEYEVMEGYSQKEILKKDGSLLLQEKKHPFRVTHLNYGIYVKREILEMCDQDP
jgi:hypothetical protein